MTMVAEEAAEEAAKLTDTEVAVLSQEAAMTEGVLPVAM